MSSSTGIPSWIITFFRDVYFSLSFIAEFQKFNIHWAQSISFLRGREVVVVQLLSCVWVFVTAWITACQASLSLTIPKSLLKFMSIELVMPSNYVIPCSCFSYCSESFSVSGSFPVSQLFASGGQSIGASASALVFPVNVQGWFPLGLTGLISLLSKGLLRLFSSTTVQNLQFFGAQPSLWSDFHIYTWLLEKSELWLYWP